MTGTPRSDHAHRRLLRRSVMAVVAVGLAAAAALGVSQGYRGFVVATPSMAEAAPVGSLVITHPQDSYERGDVISFRHEDRVYTHRVDGVADAGYRTRGDLNSTTDPWVVAPDDVVGKAGVMLPGVGWLVRGLPYLLIGFTLVHLVSRTRWVRGAARWSVRLAGGSLVVAGVGFFLRPWANFQVLGYRPSDDGDGALVHLVNTGILPLSAHGTRLLPGQDALVQVATSSGEAGKALFSITPHLALGPWLTALVVGACLVPAVVALLLGRESVPSDQSSDPPRRTASRSLPKRPRLTQPAWHGAAALLAAVLTVGIVLAAAPPSHAAFTGSITNAQNAAGSRTWFTCDQAARHTNGSYFAYPLDDEGLLQGLTAVRDISGNNQPGAYSLLGVTLTAAKPCARDTTGSVHLDGAVSTAIAGPAASVTGPTAYSTEIWFRTSTAGGKLIGFGVARTGSSGSADRHMYLDNTGHLVFGAATSGSSKAYVRTSGSVNDNRWHHAVATHSTSTGMALYLDGVLQGTSAPFAALTYTGYWRIGYDNLAGWNYAPSNHHYKGDLSYAAAYPRALSAAEVTEHYLAGQP